MVFNSKQTMAFVSCNSYDSIFVYSETRQEIDFDVKCKVGNFISDTKDFQKKGANNSKEQLKKVKDKIKLPK